MCRWVIATYGLNVPGLTSSRMESIQQSIYLSSVSRGRSRPPVLKDLAELVENVWLRLAADMAFLAGGVFVVPNDAAIATLVDGGPRARAPSDHLSSDNLSDRQYVT